jgi:hypothetical protein
MKNLPCLVLLTPIAGLGILALASTFGFEFPFAFVAAHLLGFTCAAGALVIFLKDYAPRRDRLINTIPVTTPAAPANESASRIVMRSLPTLRRSTRRAQRDSRAAIPARVFTRDPATLTLS